MDLWTDYEGRTIAGSFPLGKLLHPEGRSAFFSTSNGTGTPAVIRLLEALNDEQEILARWRIVADLNQVNLVAIRKCGETVVDGTPLIYAVMEPTDASLADVLCERPLTVEEIRQLATSLVAALAALHSRNLVHEHIEPDNVFASGEVVKLRSDCIRDVPEYADPAELKARDVHDLAVLLLHALTQRNPVKDGAVQLPAAPLPAPFNEIVRNGISGVWGLPEIAAALTPPAQPRPSRASARVPAKPVEAAKVPTPAPAPAAPAAPAPAAVKPAAAIPIPPIPAAPTPSTPPAPSRRTPEPEEVVSRRTGMLIAGAVALLALLFIVLHFLRSGPASQPNSATQKTVSTPAVSAVVPAQQAAKPSPGNAAVLPGKPSSTGRPEWRVVAFTYNHASQAQHKVESIAKQHASLKPEVFTPSGLPPYLVTLGGPMTHEEALALRAKARAAGLAHDIYVQNYSGKAR